MANQSSGCMAGAHRTNGDIAAGIIETENANVKAIVLKKGSPMTMEYNFCRVLVFVDDNRVVTQAPVIG
ncbi:hypothetical protein GH714_026478 [Hevea brasiliensis]|uniref:Uncharacterized protein n=1 Tax=Hevea brasiliensis TaxID=3981 RepID=A0A6A6NJH4_HEVBR|nr:hypothetical protein GH714_026478 [Hevea brasiliensis]